MTKPATIWQRQWRASHRETARRLSRESEQRLRELHPLHDRWREAKQRTTNPNHKQWSNYGGRGIRMAPEWLDSFETFETYILTNLGEPPEGTSLDRIDNDRGYEPGNIRWATRSEQRLNQRPKRERAYTQQPLTVGQSRQMGNIERETVT